MLLHAFNAGWLLAYHHPDHLLTTLSWPRRLRRLRCTQGGKSC